MNWHEYVRTQLADITGDAARDEEIIEELAQHLAEQYEEARASGAAHAEALEQAMRETRESAYLAQALRSADRPRTCTPMPPAGGDSHMLQDVLQDVRYAVRLLGRSPGFSAAAILTLTLGIGITTAIFSVVDAVLLRPIPFPEPERLLMVWETDRDTGTTREPGSFPDFVDFQQRSRRVNRIAAFLATDANLTPDRGEPLRLAVLAVTHDLLPLLGVRPIFGRSLTQTDDRPGGGDVVLISERLWERQFQRDAAAIGRTIRLDDRPRTIIGVLPARSDFGVLQILSAADYGRGFADRDARTSIDVWVPLQADAQTYPRDTHPLLLLASLGPKTTISQAQEELASIAADLEKAYRSNNARGVFVEPLRAVIFGPIEPALIVLMASVGVVLLISCVNVANLLLARGTSRLREMAVRSALGAETRRLARQFVVESAVLTVTSAVLGILLAFLALRVLVTMAPAEIPRLNTVSIDGRVLLLALGISIVVAFVFGLVPVAQARRSDLQVALKAEDTRGASSGGDGRLIRSVLVVAEVALAVVLLSGAGLLIKSFWHLQRVNPGFDAAGVLKAEFQLPSTRYPVDFKVWPNFAAVHRFNAALLAGVNGLPGVEVVALAGNHPLDAGFTNSFVVVGRELEAKNWPEISIRRVTPAYFSALRIPLVRGRMLNEGDSTFAPPVVMINEAAARRFFAGRDPLGQQLAFWGARRTIVGILGDERFHGLTEPSPIAAYAPLSQAPSVNGAEALIVRTRADPAGLIGMVRTAIAQVDPSLAVFGVEPLEQTLANSVSEQRFMMVLLGIFAALALVLASIGIHGVLSYSVAQRTREIGIRMALGADRRRVTQLIVGLGAKLTVIGLAAGLVLSVLFSRWLASLLFGVSPGDPATLAAVLGVLGSVATLSIWIPTRRAIRVNPLDALRQE